MKDFNFKKRINAVFQSSRTQSSSRSPQPPPATTDTLIDTFIRTNAGEVIPPELFENILMFVSTDDRRREVERRLRRDRSIDWVQRQIEVYKAGPMYTLKSCSLVCRYWAKQCRQYLFQDATILFSSYKSAEEFRHYTQNSCKTLGPPIASFIKTIHVILDYHVTEPFLHLIYLPQTRDKLIELQVRGPFPESLASSLRSTPHWNLAHNASVTPHATVAYKTITLTKLEFASFKDTLKYIQHFGDVENLRLFSIRWNPASGVPLTFIESARRPRRRLQVAVSASGCTNNLLLCLHGAMMYTDFPLRGVPDQDHNWMVDLLTRVDKFYADVPPSEHDNQSGSTYSLASFDRTRADRPSISFEVYGIAADYPQFRAHFVCKPRPPIEGRTSPGPIRVLGVAVIIDPPFRDVSPKQLVKRTIDLTVIRKEIDELCGLQVVVVALADYTGLRALVEKHKALREPLGDGREYLLACRRSEEHPFPEVRGGDGRFNKTWVGIDPVTLKATGDNWVNDRDIVPSLFEHA